MCVHINTGCPYRYRALLRKLQGSFCENYYKALVATDSRASSLDLPGVYQYICE